MSRANDRETSVYALHLEDGVVRYIGISVNPGNRLSKHRWQANNGSALAVHRWMRKHGPENVRQTVLELCPTWSEAVVREVALVAEYADLLNLTAGGEGRVGFSLSAETRARIGDANRGKRRTDAERDRIRQTRTGTKATPETRAKMSATRLGQKRTSGPAISAAQKLRTNTPEGRAKMGYALHVRWHENKGTTKPECSHCVNSTLEYR